MASTFFDYVTCSHCCFIEIAVVALARPNRLGIQWPRCRLCLAVVAKPWPLDMPNMLLLQKSRRWYFKKEEIKPLLAANSLLCKVNNNWISMPCQTDETVMLCLSMCVGREARRVYLHVVAQLSTPKMYFREKGVCLKVSWSTGHSFNNRSVGRTGLESDTYKFARVFVIAVRTCLAHRLAYLLPPHYLKAVRCIPNATD